MNASTPQVTLPLEFSGKEYAGRKTTPGDVGDSLFHRLLRKANDGDDDGSLGALAWIPALLQDRVSGSDDAASGKSGNAGRGTDITGLRLNKLMVPSTDVPTLSRVLERLGFSSREIDKLFLSLSEKDGSIRLDRLLAKLQGMMQAKGDATSSLQVNSSDIPKVEEALFKMGLNVTQVRDAAAKALDSEGNLDLGRLTSALSRWFSGVDGETEKHLAAVLRRNMNIELRPGSMEQLVKDAGLEQALQRLKGDSPDALREAMKREITLLLQQKGIPAEDVKRFLETLSIRRTEEGRSDNRQAVIQGDSAVGIAVRKDGTQWRQGGWQERILDILNREDLRAGRGNGLAPGKEGPFAGLKPTDGSEEAFLGRLVSGKAGARGGASSLPGSGWDHRGAEALVRGTATDASKTVIRRESVQGRPVKESSGTRTAFSVDFSGSRVDRSAPAGTASVRTSTLAVSLPEPLPRIVDRMIWMVQAGQQTSRIQISPPELGRLDLEIVIKQGHLQAHIHAENPAVKELIEANLQQLRQQLNQMGFVVERFEVAAGLDERRFAEQQTRTGGRGSRGRGRQTDPGGTVETGGVQAGGSASGIYRVDVHV